MIVARGKMLPFLNKKQINLQKSNFSKSLHFQNTLDPNEEQQPQFQTEYDVIKHQLNQAKQLIETSQYAEAEEVYGQYVILLFLKLC